MVSCSAWPWRSICKAGRQFGRGIGMSAGAQALPAQSTWHADQRRPFAHPERTSHKVAAPPTTNPHAHAVPTTLLSHARHPRQCPNGASGPRNRRPNLPLPRAARPAKAVY